MRFGRSLQQTEREVAYNQVKLAQGEEVSDADRPRLWKRRPGREQGKTAGQVQGLDSSISYGEASGGK